MNSFSFFLSFFFFTACSYGFYGDRCLNACGNCKSGGTCNHINGACESGCPPGFKAPFCNDGEFKKNLDDLIVRTFTRIRTSGINVNSKLGQTKYL